MSKNKITIYTDGSARGNPGPGGWGALIKLGEKEIELGGREDYTTNNKMELTAPTEALKYLKTSLMSRVALDIGEVEIFSDSKYVINGITNWIFNWQKNNWKTANKKPVLNKELWEDLYKVTLKFNIKWNYVEGHSGDKGNERADEIATSFADNLEIKLKK